MSEIARVASLGHVGISVGEMDKMVDFYTRVLGLTVTDAGGPAARLVFLSADPAREQHEFVLAVAPERRTNAQQISFAVSTLDDLRQLHQAIRDHPESSNIRVTNRGIAISCTFEDPENNRIEVYWPTGVDYVQPEVQPIDLELSNEEVQRILDGMPPRPSDTPHYYGADTGKRIPISDSL